MKFALLLSALVAAAFADAGTIYEPSYYPSEPLPIDTNPSSRIVNGVDARRGEVPHQISIRRRLIITFSHICGGTIIGPSWILTAAHCVFNQNPDNFRIVAGALLLNENVVGQQTINVQRIISHPGYPGGNQVAPDDIALLHLAQSLVYTETTVRPARLPAANSVWTGWANVSGWGLTRTGGSVPNQLQILHAPIVPANQCGDILDAFLGGAARNPFSRTLNVCSGIVNGGESACNGDSGGPLAQGDTVIGVVSWGLTPCGEANAPSVYGRVASYTAWIAAQSNGEVTA